MGERLRRLAFRALLAVLWAGAGYYGVLGGEYDLFQLREIEAARDSAAAEVDSLRALADSVERQADRLSEDPFAIERVAREEYGLIRPGERLFWFVAPAPGS